MCHDCAEERRIHEADFGSGKSAEDYAIVWQTPSSGFGIETSWRSKETAVVWINAETNGAEHATMTIRDLRAMAERLTYMADRAEAGYSSRESP